MISRDLGGLCVEWGTETAGKTAVFLPSRLEGYNDFLRKFFAADIQKVSHEVKDLTRALLEEGLPAEGIAFDTALAGYLLDATAGHYDLERLAMSWFHTAVPKAEAYLSPRRSSSVSWRKMTVSSTRLRNSGRKVCLSSSSTARVSRR